MDRLFYSSRAKFVELRFSEQEQNFEPGNANIVLPSRFWKHGGGYFIDAGPKSYGAGWSV